MKKCLNISVPDVHHCFIFSILVAINFGGTKPESLTVVHGLLSRLRS